MHRREIIWNLLSPQKQPQAQKLCETSVAAAWDYTIFSFGPLSVMGFWIRRKFYPFQFDQFYILKNIVCSYKMLRDNKITPMIWAHTWGKPMAWDISKHSCSTHSILVLCWIYKLPHLIQLTFTKWTKIRILKTQTL